MDVKKEQKIVVFTSLTPADKNLILSGINLADVFKKELCLIFRLNKKERNKQELTEEKLNTLLAAFKQEIKAVTCSARVTTEKLVDLPYILADDHEAIMLIANAAHYKIYAKAATESPVPFLFINTEAPLSTFKKIILPIDLRKENSDTALWCSWFGRFARAEITAVAANEKDHHSQQLVARNVMMAKKLFQKTGISHKIYKGQKSSFRNSFEALEYALNSETGLFVLLGSSVITPLDRLIGLPERKIIDKAGNLPVLLVNPRRDNYILCD
jgi:hypothetical protein